MKLKPHASTRSPLDELHQIRQKLIVYQSRESFSKRDLQAIRQLIDRAKDLTDKL